MRQRPDRKFEGEAFVALRRIAMDPESLDEEHTVYADPEEDEEVD